MKFAYSGADTAGRAVSGTIEAAGPREAGELLRAKGIAASDLRPDDGKAAATKGARSTSRHSLRHVADFTRQLAVLVGTGTPLVDAVASLERQAKAGPWRDVLADIRQRTEEGTPLSVALGEHPDYFDGVCRSLIAAGEQGGKLEVLLDRLASLTRQQLKVRNAVAGALVYPCVLIGVAILVTVSMIGFVLPRFEGLFKTLSTPLPPTTKFLMALSEALRQHWLILGVATIALVVGGVAWVRSRSGRAALDRAMVRLPVVGVCTRTLIIARISRVLGVLLEGRVPLLESLQLTRGSTGHSMYVDLMVKAEEALTRGETLASSFERSPLVPPAVCEAVRNGERSGKIGPVLSTMADYLDEDNEVALRTLTRMVEPVILLLLGLIVGTIAISMFLPLFDLTSAAGAGGPGA